MKLCMIGTRGHYESILKDISSLPNINIKGICAGSKEDDIGALEKWCKENSHEYEVFEDYKNMLDTVHPDILCIDGPFEKHAEMCIESFKRNIHVITEKPAAITWSDFEQLKVAYDKTKVHFVGMMDFRYNPAYYTAWKTIQEGAIGDIRLISTRKSYKLGERPPFYKTRKTYGGTIPWVGIHAIDWIYWFSGKSFKSVYASHSVLNNRNHGEMEMTAMCQFTLNNDIFASVSMDYLRPSNAPTHGDDRIRVAGTDGVIEVHDGEVFLINKDTNGEINLDISCDRQIFSDFVNHIEGKSTGLLNAEDTFTVTEACLLACQSADENKVINF